MNRSRRSGRPAEAPESGSVMRQEAIRVLIVEDHATVGAALAAAISAADDIEVVGLTESITSLAAFCDAADEHPDPTVAVVDFALPDGDGIDATYLIAQHYPAARSLILSASRSSDQLRDAVSAGCVGYVMKSAPLADLFRVIRSAAAGQASFDADTFRDAVNTNLSHLEPMRGGDVRLSDRESEILALLAAGLSTEVMATQLYLSSHTVRNHVRNLTAKLGVHSRLEAVSVAARAGLISFLAEQAAERP
jgi:two-component system nitrate/nitrite response regulator NarL